jgi:5-methylcytosine-specific restriction endonuclease McrA
MINLLSIDGYKVLGLYSKNKRRYAKMICPFGHINNIMAFNFKNGHRCKKCAYTGNKNSHWKGGVVTRNIPLYNTYYKQLDTYEEVRRSSIDENILEVRCTYCNKWYIPKRTSVRSRIQSIIGQTTGENRFYCSNGCKGSCEIFNQQTQIKGHKPNKYTREVQPQLRKIVLERDNWKCQKCSDINIQLHCHHIDPVVNNPIESADIDNCITLCKKCHKKVHKQVGCGYNDLKCGR